VNFESIGYLFAAALIVFLVGLTAGDGSRESTIMKACDVSGRVVMNGKAYECKPLLRVE